MYLFHMHILRNSTESTLNLCERKYSSLLVYVKTTMFSQGRNMLVFMMLRYFQNDSFFLLFGTTQTKHKYHFHILEIIGYYYIVLSALNFKKHQICPVLPDFAHIFT